MARSILRSGKIQSNVINVLWKILIWMIDIYPYTRDDIQWYKIYVKIDSILSIIYFQNDFISISLNILYLDNVNNRIIVLLN